MNAKALWFYAHDKKFKEGSWGRWLATYYNLIRLGRFKNFKESDDYMHIFVENVLNDKFFKALLKHHVRVSHMSAVEDCYSSSQICKRCGFLFLDKGKMEEHNLFHRKIK